MYALTCPQPFPFLCVDACSDHSEASRRRIPWSVTQCGHILAHSHCSCRSPGSHSGCGKGEHCDRSHCRLCCCSCCDCSFCCCFHQRNHYRHPQLYVSSCCSLQNLSFEDRSDSWVRQEAGTSPPTALVSLANRKKKRSEQLVQVATPDLAAGRAAAEAIPSPAASGSGARKLCQHHHHQHHSTT